MLTLTVVEGIDRMSIVIVVVSSLIAGWLVNLAADNVPDRRPFFSEWYLPFFRLPTLFVKWFASPLLLPFLKSDVSHVTLAKAQTPSQRVIAVWVGSVVLGWISYFHSGAFDLESSLTTIAMALYSWFFLAIAIIDLEHRKVYNRMLLAATPIMLLFTPFIQGPTIWSALGGGIFGFLLFLVLALVWPGAMGMGDVKLAGVIGLVTGFPGIIVAILICIFSGGFVAAGLLLRTRFKRGQTIAYAPYLVLGAWIALYYGTELWDAYMSLQ